MRRGDVVTVVGAGDYGKPRPAIVVQSDALPDAHASGIVCQMTSEITDGVSFRILIEPDSSNGLRTRSQVMVDKPVTLRRERIGRMIGRLGSTDMARVDVALTFVIGLAD